MQQVMEGINAKSAEQISQMGTEPVKKKKSLLGRLKKGITKSVKRLGRTSSIKSTQSIQDSAHSVQEGNLSSTDLSITASLQTTQEEDFVQIHASDVGMVTPDGLYTGLGSSVEQVPEESNAADDELESETEPTSQSELPIQAEESTVIRQVRAVVTIQRTFKKYLTKKRSTEGMEEVIKKAEEEMEDESPGRRTVEVVGSAPESKTLLEMKRESFFMMKMGIAILLIALVIRFGVLPMLGI
eukprot:TRINITY_DN8586_c0_g1_i1.p1 TRINITY_DN8586_c0_g1~~TRINITY_DN8586_c0_g1_i1.p1  ORF type:complete len:242 (-),score=26.45 TRINITY_DN8586_c0_g1_i1:663-1388(-)